MTKVLVVGGVSFDSIVYVQAFPDPQPQTVFSRDFHETVGSTGAGKALSLSRLGLDVTLHGLIGDDEQGQFIRAYFERENLRFVYDIDLQGTERHINLMDDAGDRLSIYARSATFEPEIDWNRLESWLSGADVLVLNIINYCRHLVPLAQKYAKLIWCDIHDYDGKSPYHQDFIDAADYIFMSSDAMPDYKPFMQALIERGKQLVVCTHGKAGASALTAAGQWLDLPIIEMGSVKDTNGAGDSFFAGFLYGHIQGYDLARCMKSGMLVAGLTVTSYELAHPDLSPARLKALL